jgi:hypothetical protein
LVKSVTCQVVAGRPRHVVGWPSHVAGRPWSSVSTNFQLVIPLYHLLESFTAKPAHERLQGGVGRLEGLAGWPPPRPIG